MKEELQDMSMGLEEADQQAAAPKKNKRSLLSQEALAAWDQVVELPEGSTRPATGQVLRILKNKRHQVSGLLMAVEGVEAFMPASLTGITRKERIASYIGETMEVEIIRLNKEECDMIVARTGVERHQPEPKEQVDEDNRKEQKLERLRQAMAELSEGQIIKGKIVAVSRHGILVQVTKELRGLVHRSNLPWVLKKGVRLPVNIGDQINVIIKELNMENTRISLGLADLEGKEQLTKPTFKEEKARTVSQPKEAPKKGFFQRLLAKLGF